MRFQPSARLIFSDESGGVAGAARKFFGRDQVSRNLTRRLDHFVDVNEQQAFALCKTELVNKWVGYVVPPLPASDISLAMNFKYVRVIRWHVHSASKETTSPPAPMRAMLVFVVSFSQTTMIATTELTMSK